MTTAPKPTDARRSIAFIGSSAEGLDVAKAIQQNLDHNCETQIWTQGVFGLSGGTLDTLLQSLDRYDFAILVHTPDDRVESRGKMQASSRDNVLLELGMFLAALGPERTFIVYDRSSDTKIPSDLAGVTLADYVPPQSGNYQSAVGAACTKITESIKRLGNRPAANDGATITEHATYQIIHDLLDPTAEQFMVLMHEEGKSLPIGSLFGGGIKYQYAFDDGRGGQGFFSVRDFCRKLADAGLLVPDLRENVSLTDRGRAFVDWLKEKGHKAVYFESNFGGWGSGEEAEQKLQERMQSMVGKVMPTEPGSS